MRRPEGLEGSFTSPLQLWNSFQFRCRVWGGGTQIHIEQWDLMRPSLLREHCLLLIAPLSIMFQRHAALLVANIAACLISGFDFQIWIHWLKETPRYTELSVSHTQIKILVGTSAMAIRRIWHRMGRYGIRYSRIWFFATLVKLVLFRTNLLTQVYFTQINDDLVMFVLSQSFLPVLYLREGHKAIRRNMKMCNPIYRLRNLLEQNLIL